jgi:hypothetical protein
MDVQEKSSSSAASGNSMSAIDDVVVVVVEDTMLPSLKILSATMNFFLPAEMEAHPMTDSTIEHVLNLTRVGKIGLPADIALGSMNIAGIPTAKV